jgi:dTDP-4-dehydrorhamnose reductase
MRLALTGASGLLGRALMRELQAAGHAVVGCARRRGGAGRRLLDLTDSAATEAFMREARPAALIHAAAERRPDVCENDAPGTWRINVEATERLARLCAASGTHMVFVSTDYVFDGTCPPYGTADALHPLNAYGRSKAQGEAAVRAVLPQATVLRMPILYGRVEEAAECQVSAMIEALRGGYVGAVDDWATRFPTWVDDVGVFLTHWTAALERGEDVSGVWHVSGREAVTKYAMARRIAAVLHLSADGLQPSAQPMDGAPRPRNSQLDCSRALARGWLPCTPFDEALRQVAAYMAGLRDQRL